MKPEYKRSGSLVSTDMKMESPTEVRGDDFKVGQSKAEEGTKVKISEMVNLVTGDC